MRSRSRPGTSVAAVGLVGDSVTSVVRGPPPPPLRAGPRLWEERSTWHARGQGHNTETGTLAAEEKPRRRLAARRAYCARRWTDLRPLSFARGDGVWPDGHVVERGRGEAWRETCDRMRGGSIRRGRRNTGATPARGMQVTWSQYASSWSALGRSVLESTLQVARNLAVSSELQFLERFLTLV